MMEQGQQRVEKFNGNDQMFLLNEYLFPLMYSPVR